MAPEILDGKSCDQCSDVYAYGILVYTTITKRVPYEGVTCNSLRAEVIGGRQPHLPVDVDPRWLGLMQLCWNQDPLMRPGWKWICEELGGNKFLYELSPNDVSRFTEYRALVSPRYLEFHDEASLVRAATVVRGPPSIDGFPGKVTDARRFGMVLHSRPNAGTVTGQRPGYRPRRIAVRMVSQNTAARNAMVPALLLPSELALDRTRHFKSMRKIRELGQGIFGVVNLVEDPKTQERIVATTIKLNESLATHSYADFMEEMESLISQVHPCVVEIVGYSLPEANDDCCAIVGTKFASKGSLKTVIQDGSLGDTETAIIVCGMVLGMQFIHSKGIVHCDLVPSNVFLDDRGYARIGDAWIARLADLGIISIASAGSPAYMAPEMFTDVVCEKPVDVYSFALILYELVVGEPAFNPLMEPGEILNQVVSGVHPKLPESMNATLKEIIQRGWDIDPKVRDSFDEIWSLLEGISFRLTPNVDYARVAEFISSIKKSVPLPDPQPINLELVSPVAISGPAGAKLTPIVKDSRSPIEEKSSPDATPVSEWVKNFTGMRRIRELGKGAYGTVTLVEDPSTHNLIALKTFHEPVTDITTAFFREVESLIRLAHPCIVPIIGYFLATETSHAQIGTKYAVNGSLREALTKRSLDDTGLAIVACGIVVGMKFIHSRGMMHRDLKPENILLDDQCYAQIGDLGSSRFRDLGLTLTRGVGTPYYKAPEMYEDDDYTSAIDVYSFAVMLYEMLVGEYIFPLPISSTALMTNVVTGVRPTLPLTMNDTLASIIRRCWSVHAKDRDTFEQVWSHFEQINFQFTPNVDGARVAAFVAWVREHSSMANRESRYAVELSSFKKINDIGEGAFGILYSARDPRTGRIVAVKLLKCDVISESAKKNFQREVEILASIEHETLLSLRGYVPLSGGRPAILTDYMSGGSLGRLLKMEREMKISSGWDDIQKLIVLYGISVGMLILHRNEIIHRDLKPDNILLNDCFEPKVADFGLSKFVDASKAASQTKNIGTPSYMAPEMLSEGPYDWAVDVYAYGILVYTTITKRVPYEGKRFASSITLGIKVLEGIRPDLPEDLDVKWRTLIEDCWQEEPTVRPSWEQICRRLGSVEFLRGFNELDRSKFIEYRQRISPAGFPFSD
jgi:serine/threonine protein kinase